MFSRNLLFSEHILCYSREKFISVLYLACWVKFSVDDILIYIYFFFLRKQALTVHANCLLKPWLHRGCNCDETKNLSVADQSQRSQQSCKGVGAKSQCGHRLISVADCLLGIPKRRIVTGLGAQRLVISRWSVANPLVFMPRHQKVAGYYVIPSEILSVRPSVSAPTILLPATPPTVLGQSFSNFTGAFRIVWRCAYCFFRILKLFSITFFSFLT